MNNRDELTDTESPAVEYLIRLYEMAHMPLDKLPYSEEFEQLVRRYRLKVNPRATFRELYLALVRLRKAGDLPRLFR